MKKLIMCLMILMLCCTCFADRRGYTKEFWQYTTGGIQFAVDSIKLSGSNSVTISPVNDLLTNYNLLKNDTTMGTLSASNRRSLILTPGTYTIVTASLTSAYSDYVDIIGMAEDSVILDAGAGSYVLDDWANQPEVILRGFRVVTDDGADIIYPSDPTYLKTSGTELKPMPKPTFVDTLNVADWTPAGHTSETAETTLLRAGIESAKFSRSTAGSPTYIRDYGAGALKDWRGHVFFIRYYIEPATAGNWVSTGMSLRVIDTSGTSDYLALGNLPLKSGWNEFTIDPGQGSYFGGSMTDLSTVQQLQFVFTIPAGGSFVVFDCFMAIPTNRTKAAVIFTFDDAIQSAFFVVAETVKDLFVYMETIADERKKHEVELLKTMYETRLTEQYNTFKFDGHLEYHREYSDKKGNTNRYNKYKE